MYKSSFFTGQPIFAQVLSPLSKTRVSSIAARYDADRYYKSLKTYEHLVSLLYGVLNHCTSLREVATGLLAWEHRVQHLNINYHVRRSTLADANRERNPQVFEAIYLDLLKSYRSLLPDSRLSKENKNLFIMDSTTYTLFQEILKGAGVSPVNGKRKGGIKVHTLINAAEDVPCLVRMSAAAAHDGVFLQEVNLPFGSILVIDRGYANHYKHLNKLDAAGITWVSRLRSNSAYQVVAAREIPLEEQKQGVLKDAEILLGHSFTKKAVKVKARLIEYRDAINNHTFYFITNNLSLPAITICNYYKQRWQIETLFKRLKQNFPLNRFYGDNENAIKVQIWTALIADLLIKIIKTGAAKKWSFSNLVTMIRLHLMTYIHLQSFLKNPDKTLLQRMKKISQPSLFPT